MTSKIICRHTRNQRNTSLSLYYR